MSEQTTSFGWVVIASLLMIAVGALLWMSQPADEASNVERAIAVASVFFALFLLFKQRWALIGANLTLLSAVIVFFIQLWSQPIMAEDTSLIWPNAMKMAIAIVLFILVGRDRIDQSFFMRI